VHLHKLMQNNLGCGCLCLFIWIPTQFCLYLCPGKRNSCERPEL